jgi:hypothetical protein
MRGAAGRPVREPGGPTGRPLHHRTKEETTSRRQFLFALPAVGLWFAAPPGVPGQVYREGAYYNPYTGASSAERATYNPYTGTDTRTESGYNPYTGRDVTEKQVYNPYTGRSEEVRTSTNPYTGRSTYSAAYRRR